MKQLKITRSILKIVSREYLLYPSRSFVEITTILARYGVLLLLYSYIFKYKNGSINGTTFQIIAWSMFIYFSIMMLSIRNICNLIMNDIKSGAIEMLFSKPLNYLVYKISWQLSAGLYPFLAVTFFGSIILYMYVGIPETMSNMLFVITFLISFIFSIINAICIYTIVGLGSFWFEDITSVRWIVDKLVMIFGGSYLPVALFPRVLYLAAIWSPFGAAYFVTHTVNITWKDTYQKLLGIQFFWLIILMFLVSIIFYRAQKSLSVNGG